MLRGPEANAVAVAEEVELFYLRVFAVGEADVDEADGLACVRSFTSAWAGEASDAETERAMSDLAYAFGEGACNLDADGAIFFDEFEGNVGEIGLLFAGVDDGAAVKAARGVGQGAEPLREQ